MAVKKPVGPGLLVAAAALVVLALGAAPAGAAPCTTHVLCDAGDNPLRSDVDNNPEGYGTDALASNTEGTLRLRAFEGEELKALNENPANYAYFGLELRRNPETGCGTFAEAADGWVTHADIQNATAEVEIGGTPVTIPSPVFAGISPAKFGPWPISVRSNTCATDPGGVKVTNVHLLFPALQNTEAIGTFVGEYVQPGEGCEAGGIQLDVSQPGVALSIGGTPVPSFEAQIDDGEGNPALICFVSANNYVYPEEAPDWSPLEGAIWKDAAEEEE